MATRFTYSRWDGSQVGFDLDADRILEEMTDDLLYHGDLNAALRRMLQSGFRDRNGERIQGMRDMLEKLRRKRKDALEQYDLGGVYDDIAQELRDVIDTERQGLDNLQDEARQSGDQRRQEITDEVTSEIGFLTRAPELCPTGTPDEIVARLHKSVALGITSFVISFGRHATADSLELFGKEVIPAFRS